MQIDNIDLKEKLIDIASIRNMFEIPSASKKVIYPTFGMEMSWGNTNIIYNRNRLDNTKSAADCIFSHEYEFPLNFKCRSSFFDYELQKIESYYTIKDSSEIRNFLVRHPSIPSYILKAYLLISEVFGPSVKNIALEYSKDPEEGTEELFAIIYTDLDCSSALETLHAFDDRWIVDKNVNNLFTVSIK